MAVSTCESFSDGRMTPSRIRATDIVRLHLKVGNRFINASAIHAFRAMSKLFYFFFHG